ncbi:MAG: Bug family tripartite tricarboxylate transporter substrate binding protein, partial [Hyphomicrobiaceae bacterium]
MKRRHFLSLGASTAVAAALPLRATAQVQAWPDKPVRIIVPFAAGGGTDAVARPWADKLTQAFGQQFVIENRGGASGLIGTEAAAKATPDGYTFLITGATTTVFLPMVRKVNYDAASLMPVARVGDVLCGHVIGAGAGPKTIGEVVDYAKKNPGKLAFGSSGNGTTPHLRFEAFKAKAGVDILHVPYRGGADSLTDLLAGNIQMMNEPVTLPHVKAGKLHMFAVNHTERMADFPQVPTLTESGFPNCDVPLWFTLWAPGGTSKEVIQKLNAKVVELSRTDEMKAKLALAGAVPLFQTPEEIAAFREQDRKSLAELVKTANIK